MECSGASATVNIIKWNKHYAHVLQNEEYHLRSGDFSDCVLIAEGKALYAHRLILAGISDSLAAQLKVQPDKYPIIHLDISFANASDILEFAYKGECAVEPGRLESFIADARKLAIKGIITYNSAETVAPNPEAENNTNKSPVADPNLIDMTPTSSKALGAPSTSKGPVDANDLALPKKTIDQRFAPRARNNLVESRNKKRVTFHFANQSSFECKFCDKHYQTKASHYTHERECSLNPKAICAQCPTCHLKMKPSQLSRHKKIHK